MSPLIPSSHTQTRSYNTRKSPRLHQQQLERTEEARTLERMFTREWKIGDVYAPHDLSAAEARKWRSKRAPDKDVFDVLSINPLDLYKNFSVMSEFITDMGRIKPRSLTGLRRVNQRRVAKAVKRAVAMGLMPSVYKHPEILKEQNRRDKESFLAPS
ncbi:hypothetical protein LTS08_004024 [Lithohypha guttulata]|nr:hypothetical protein LTS08_004024 [Lithohypha guttulata]